MQSGDERARKKKGGALLSRLGLDPPSRLPIVTCKHTCNTLTRNKHVQHAIHACNMRYMRVACNTRAKLFEAPDASIPAAALFARCHCQAYSKEADSAKAYNTKHTGGKLTAQ